MSAEISAHSLTISNVNVVKVNIKKAVISFNMHWEDAWHYNTIAPGNYDAVWVFAKYLATDGQWHHIKYAGYVTHEFAEIKLPSDKTGVFIYPKVSDTTSFFEGDVNLTYVALRWNLELTTAYPPAEPYQVRLYGIEMAYVPKGSFYSGVDSLEAGDALFYDTDSMGTEGYTASTYTSLLNPFPKTLIEKSNATAGGGFPQTGTSLQYQPANASFPNGYRGFYCMKYEINQQQYVDFLNSIMPSGYDDVRYCNPAEDFEHDCARIKRYSIHFDDSLAKYVTDFPNLPNEYLGWDDGAAYADWAALRPMTELEFEKACRGPASAYEPAGLEYDYAYGLGEPVEEVFELAWIGDSIIEEDTIYNLDVHANNIFFRDNWARVDICPDIAGDELAGYSQTGALANLITLRGDSLTRNNTGGSYYGIMELSGNLNERCISIRERWTSSDPDADTTTAEYDWPADNIPSCASSGVSFIIVTPKGVTKYYKDCPSNFAGTHGNGELSPDGDADVADWPKDLRGNGAGAMNRGGRWNQIKERCYVADRMPLVASAARTHEATMRFVRTF